jgi:hypothetical protein
MTVRGVLAGALLGLATAAAPAGAQVTPPPGLGVEPFVLSPSAAAVKPNVAVDDLGTGHFVWEENVNGGDDVLHYCRIPRGATACQAAQQFALPKEAFDRPAVFTPGPGQVILLTYRCCNEAVFAVISADGGSTFAPPKQVGDLNIGDAAYGPGTNAVSVVNDVSGGVSFQAMPLTGPPVTAKARVGDGGGAAFRGYDGSVGFPTANAPITAFDDLTNGFLRVWGGSGDVNDLATWKPAQPLGVIEDLRMVSGPKGVFLMGKEELTPGATDDVYVMRRYDPTTETFGPSTRISDPKLETDVIFRDAWEDAGGNVAAAWVANHSYLKTKTQDPIHYRVSTDGGKSWKPERTLVADTSDRAFNLQMGAAADGGGFLVWDRNGTGPLTAVPIPPVGAQGGAGGGGSAGADCPGTVSFGNVQAVATVGCFKKSGTSYSTSDPVRVNGLDIVPSGARRRSARAAASATITLDTKDRTIIAKGSVETKAGNIVLDKGGFSWTVPSGSGTLDVAKFTDLEKFKVEIFGFPVAGEATLQFDKNGAFIPAHLELPKLFGGIRGDVTLRLKNPGGLQLDGFSIHVGEALLGALRVKPLDVEYKGSVPPVFEGSATFLLPPSYSAPGVHVGFGFEGGKFKHAEGSIPFTPPLALAPPWAYLNQIGLALSTDPLKIAGGVELTGGPQIAGTAAIKLTALPPADGFSLTLADPVVFRASGKMSVVDVPFAHGFVEFRTSGLFKFGGGLDFTAPLGVAGVTAGVPEGPPLGPGFVDVSSGTFNAPFEGHVCVPASCSVIDVGSQGVISSNGLAACGEYFISKDLGIGVSAGFGYHWGGSADVFADLGGCDVTAYAVSATARAAQAGAVTVDVKAGLPQKNVVLVGASAPPRVTVTGPGGETVTSSADGKPATSAHMVVFSNPVANRTYVLMGKPVAGSYAIGVLPGSSPIAQVKQADGLPEPSVTAKLGGKGYRRTLAYKVKAIAGQTVRFAERAGEAAADLGVARGTSGTLRFTPTEGPAGVRQIVAAIEQDGVPRRNVVVATYRAPRPQRPGAPKFVRVKRAGSSDARVTWGAAPRAARYAVRVKLKDGTSRLTILGAKARAVTLRGVPGDTAGTITVSGLTRSNLSGPTGKAQVKRKPVKKKRSLGRRG